MTVLRCLDAVLGPRHQAVLHTEAMPTKAGITDRDTKLRQEAGHVLCSLSTFTLRDLGVQARMRVLVKRVLHRCGYPPDKQEKATQTALEQA
jgi:hypothetical protein